MTRVWDRLFIGGIDDACEIAMSNPFGITTVITLSWEPVRARRDSINYLVFPVAEESPMPTPWLDPIIDAIWENIRWGTVALLSRTGTSRAPIIATAWIHAVGCMDIDAALADIGRLRNIEPSPILLRSVKQALK